MEGNQNQTNSPLITTQSPKPEKIDPLERFFQSQSKKFTNVVSTGVMQINLFNQNEDNTKNFVPLIVSKSKTYQFSSALSGSTQSESNDDIECRDSPSNIIQEQRFQDQNSICLNQHKKNLKFENLYQTILHYFHHDKLIKNYEINLGQTEYHLLQIILAKKTSKKIEQSPIFKIDQTTKNVNELLYNIISRFQRKKKPEEYFKFLIQKAFKHLKTKFKENRQFSKEDLHQQFFNHYFQETCEKYQMPLEFMQKPYQTKQSKKHKLDKCFTINLEYIKRVILSEKFYRDLMDYIENQFIQECLKEMESKILAIIQKWEYKHLQMNQENFCEFIKQEVISSRYKMPWSIFELKTSKRKTMKLIQEAMIMNHLNEQ